MHGDSKAIGVTATLLPQPGGTKKPNPPPREKTYKDKTVNMNAEKSNKGGMSLVKNG